MVEPQNITELARQITEATEVVSAFAQKHNVKFSFGPQDPDPASLSEGTQPYHQARLAIIEASSRLKSLLSGDEVPFFSLRSHFHAASALRATQRFKLAEAVPVKGSISYGEVAKRVGLDTRTVSTIMGILMGYHIFHQPEVGYVAHTRLSHQMVAHKGFASLVDFTFGELFSYSYHLTDALVKWGPSQEPSMAAFNYARDTADSFYDYIDRHKEAQRSFSQMMDFVSSAELTNMSAIYEGFNWEELGDAVVVDVAGSVGHISIRLAQRYPNLHFIVQDYESICRRGEAMLPVEMKHRVRFQPHDLFQDRIQIPKRKAVFLLRAILHNWSEKYATRILRTIANALKPGDRILLNEQITPEPGTGAPAIEQLTRSSDMTMLSIFNGQERTKEQLRALVQSAHSGLHIVNIITPPTAALGIVEICLKDG